MQARNQSQPGALNLAHMHESGLNAIELICGSIARPVDLFLRPWSGSRYYPLPVIALSTALMLIIPGALAMFDAISGMIPFFHPSPSIGFLGIWSFTQIFALASVLHGIRIYRRMLHMHLEEHSTFDGAPLPFFPLIPWCQSFWVTRIVAEPVFLLLISVVLQDLFVIQLSLAIYLRVAAVALALKNFTVWFRSWTYLRELLDARNASPILARLAEDKASDNELAAINLAAFPKDVAPEIRTQAAVSIRAYDANN
jgi:hypothetical protein